MYRCTKIVCTIGPASQHEDTIRQLIRSGLDVARLNFSHGSHDDHAQVYQRLRSISSELNKPIAVLQDLQGPKIRTGHLKGDCVELIPGKPFKLTTRPITGDESCVSVDYPDLPEALEPGDRILLDDGNMELVVISTSEDEVETRVVLGGELKENKGVNLPGAHLEIPGFTEKDEEDLEFGLHLGIDMVAISFVRNAEDVERVRQAIARLAPERVRLPVIAKLERPEALDNLEAIIHASDGVMVARGDLGVEMAPEYVPIAQKRIIETANRHSKLVITATQMLDSMIHNPRPTRAEASDVANAILDGTDAVMLSGETASGKYPVKAVEIMNAIAIQAENVLDLWGHWKGPFEHVDSNDDTYFMTRAARELAHDRNVAAIAIFTKSGRTALLMSKTRPGVPILAFTPEAETYHLLSTYWGVTPHLVPHANTIEEMLKDVEENLVAYHPISTGEQIVLICGFPVYKVRQTNLAILHTVGETL